jgi:hypothetical protein
MVGLQNKLPALNRAYDALKPGLRSSSVDVQSITRILMRLIEDLRGDAIKTDLPQRHHE